MNKQFDYLNNIKKPILVLDNTEVVFFNNIFYNLVQECHIGQDIRHVFHQNYLKFEEKNGEIITEQIYLGEKLFQLTISDLEIKDNKYHLLFLCERKIIQNNEDYNEILKKINLGCAKLTFSVKNEIIKVKFSDIFKDTFDLSSNATFDDFLNIIKIEDRDIILEKIYSIKEKENYDFEYIFKAYTKKNGYTDYFFNAYLGREEDSNSIIFNVVDLYELNLLNEKYINVESNFKGLFSKNMDTVVIVDGNEIVAYNNTAKKTAEKYGLKVKAGENFFNFLNLNNNKNSITETIQNNTRFEINLELENGIEVFLENTIVPIYFENKQVHAFIIKDLTEEKKTLKKLEEVNSALTKFLSIVSHDLRTPFIQVISLTEILTENFEMFSEEDILKYIKLLDKAGKNGYNLLENMMEWSRVMRNKRTFEPKEFNISKTIKQTVDLLDTNAKSKNICVKYPKEEIFAFGDKNMISTILLNLISNAIKFTPQKGKIEIEAVNNEKDTLISVKDNGVGMNQKAIESLFKIDNNYTTKGTEGESGTGLGMLLVFELIKKHKAKIWADSTPDKGSSFYFTLPKK